MPPTVEWRGDHLRLIDQRRLPASLQFLECRTVGEVCDAITTLAVRGAPAIGATGALGVALAKVRGEDLDDAAERLVATRPTAVNLAWGAGRARAADDPLAEALRICAEDVQRNQAIGARGAPLLGDGARVMTHCNAGALACVGYGTALGVIRAAHEAARRVSVWVPETRPVLQGARLTAWELDRLGIAHRLVVDTMAASLMAAGEVDCVLVGADRIAANCDVVNKVGTYALAVLAMHHRVPFYVAAPSSTFDPSSADGGAVPLEQRPADEVTVVSGARIAPEGTEVDNRAFDVTPAALVTAYVTEEGILSSALGFEGRSSDLGPGNAEAAVQPARRPQSPRPSPLKATRSLSDAANDD
ncbi:MAG: S-methyl-5-thioribose-1-phosphate isomerase [Acidimicrobiia bacterium]|nr:S-methyl-5-thioribose-1-phosphate isomerase [Acidimicrobiia bacterium]